MPPGMVKLGYGYLLKPVEEQQLASAIRVAIYKHQKDTNRREGFKSFAAILRALPNAVVVTDSTLTVRYILNPYRSQEKKAQPSVL